MSASIIGIVSKRAVYFLDSPVEQLCAEFVPVFDQVQVISRPFDAWQDHSVIVIYMIWNV